MVASQIEISDAMRTEHRKIHAALVRAAEGPGRVGVTARGLARILRPHVVREAEIALRRWRSSCRSRAAR